MKKICVLGCNGMLGSVLTKTLLLNYKIFGIDKYDSKNPKETDFYCQDLLNFEKVKTILTRERPQVIINAAAIVSLEFCEENYEIAEKLHYRLSEFLTKYCEENDCKYVYISTDSIFDGNKGNYTEEDLANPLNSYAKTKYLGDQEAQKNENSIVIRTNIYGYSDNQNSLLKWGYNSLKSGRKINGYANVIFNPVSVYQLSDAINILLEKDFSGVINIGSDRNISKCEFLKFIEKFLKIQKMVEKNEINDDDSPVKRPKNTTLNINKMSKLFEKNYKSEEGIYDILKEVIV